jgi:hypothetical protein
MRAPKENPTRARDGVKVLTAHVSKDTRPIIHAYLIRLVLLGGCDD